MEVQTATSNALISFFFLTKIKLFDICLRRSSVESKLELRFIYRFLLSVIQNSYMCERFHSFKQTELADIEILTQHTLLPP